MENHIPEETIRSVTSHENPWPARLFDQLNSKGYRPPFVVIPGDVKLETQAESSGKPLFPVDFLAFGQLWN